MKLLPFLKILPGFSGGLFEANGVNLFTLFIERIIKDDLQGFQDLLVGEVPVSVHYIQVGFDFVDRSSTGGFGKRGGVSVSDIVGALVSGEVGFGQVTLPSSRMISSGASYFVANETFVVSDVFGSLGGCEVNAVYVHCHRIFGGFPGSGEGNIVGSSL